MESEKSILLFGVKIGERSDSKSCSSGGTPYLVEWKKKKKRSSSCYTPTEYSEAAAAILELRSGEKKRPAGDPIDQEVYTAAETLLIILNGGERQNQSKRQRIVLVDNPILPEQFNIRIAQVMRRSTGSSSSSTGGSDIRQQPALVLVCEKELTKSDISPHHNRLLIPFKILRTNDFLTEDEKRILNASGEKRYNIEIRLIHASTEPRTINLRQWNMRSSQNYVLTTTWNRIVQTNNLNEKNTIQLWSFRDNDHNLYFALVKKN